MSTKLICSKCEKDYETTGTTYQRKEGGKVDYYCSKRKGGCGCDRKPIEVEVSTNNETWKMEGDGYGQWTKEPLDKIPELTGIDKAYSEQQQGADGWTQEAIDECSLVPADRNVLVVGDLHLPFSKAGYLEFCVEQYKKHNCTDVVFIGDIIDNHYSSFHEADPDGHGAGDELDKAYVELAKWKKAFPVAKVCLGNHDLIPNRKAFSAGLSNRWIRSISDVFKLDGWEFAEEFEIDNVVYTHGTGSKAFKKATDDMCSYVCGHWHTELSVTYKVGRRFKIFGVQAGCGVDVKSYAMAYGKYFKKPAIGCALIKENGKVALVESMEMGI